VRDVDGDDLGALFARITRRLIDAERPVLASHGLSMWEYIVLSELSRRAAETQLALAETIGYDKTRLIGLLDKLQYEGLIAREPAPADRRARTVRLTEAGRARHIAVRNAIRTMEDGLLEGLDGGEQRTLRKALTVLEARR
jgi:DNA-binding MarR family transcriptional regulator